MVGALCCINFEHSEFVTWASWALKQSTFPIDFRAHDHHLNNPQNSCSKNLQLMLLPEFGFIVRKKVLSIFTLQELTLIKPWWHHFSSIPNRMKGHNCLNDWIFHCPRESSLRMRPFEISHKIFKIWKLQIRWKSRLENQFSSWLQTSGWSIRCHLSDRISRWKFKNLQKIWSKFRGFGREVI